MRHEKRFFLVRGDKKIRRLGKTAFVTSLALSLISTAWALYVKGVVGKESLVGLITSLFIAISFLSYFFIIPIIEKRNKLRIVIISSIMLALIYFSYAFITNLYVFIIVACVMSVIGPLRTSAMGLIVKSNCQKKKLSRSEGFIYTIYNISFFIGPLIGGFILKNYDINYIFVIAPIIFLLGIWILKSAKLNEGGQKKKIDTNVIKNLMDFFKDKDRAKAYMFHSGVNFWWSLIYIFIPLMMIKSLDIYWVGIFLAFVAVPLILFEVPFAARVGRKGYKWMFFLGFLIPAIVALLCFIFFNIWFMIAALILASIGLAMLEPTTESYFFDVSKGKEDQRFYAPYNTAIDTGSLLGRLLPALFLLFLDIKYVLLIFAVGMAFLSLLSLTIRDVIEDEVGKKKVKDRDEEDEE